MKTVQTVFGLLGDTVAEPQAYDAETLNKILRPWRKNIIRLCMQSRRIKRELQASRDLYNRYRLQAELAVSCAQLREAFRLYRQAQEDCRTLWDGYLIRYARQA